MILSGLDISAEEFSAGTGWAIKPEGACSGDICVPLPDGFSVEGAAGRLGMPLLHDETHGVWALGPATVSGRALTSVDVPPLTLPDVDGTPFALESLRGQKVLLVAWASW